MFKTSEMKARAQFFCLTLHCSFFISFVQYILFKHIHHNDKQVINAHKLLTVWIDFFRPLNLKEKKNTAFWNKKRMEQIG